MYYFTQPGWETSGKDIVMEMFPLREKQVGILLIIIAAIWFLNLAF